ncbi:MAG: histone deacetylase [Pseudomonadota bacterium]
MVEAMLPMGLEMFLGTDKICSLKHRPVPPKCVKDERHDLRRTGIVKDRRYLDHGSAYVQPESPARLESIYAMLEQPDMDGHFIEIAPRHAGLREISLVHDPDHIDRVAGTAGKAHTYLDPDTETTPESFETARLAVGGLFNAIDQVMTGRVDNVFALIRPPGHHAGKHESAGFCLFNNVALGAMHAMNCYGLSRILIADWDLHHGDGTARTFYDDKRVLYFSTHQYPAYPGTGALEEIGRGEGIGHTINVPLRPGAGNAQYVKIFRKLLEPVALAFKPELVMVSAGFDIYARDPLGGMKVTSRGFAYLTRILMNIADACCQGRLVLALEGGYHIDGQTASVKAVLKELRDETKVSQEELSRIESEAEERFNPVEPLINSVLNRIKLLWQTFT